MDNIKQFIITSGGYLHHIGFLTDDTAKTLSDLSRYPGMGEWTTNEGTWSRENMLVGAKNTMLCSTAKMFDGMLIEVIEPVAGKCENTHLAEYLAKNGAGMHHLCYGIPYHEDYQKIYEHMVELGCKDVIHGQKKDADGKVTDEFCYFEISENAAYLELCLTRVKWGY